MNKEFLWGSATAAYQCEGGWKEGGKGLSNWDVFCHSEKNSVNPVTGDVACDFYHHYEEDIRMLAEGGQNAYRFSIAWTRILPDGTGRKSQEGIDFYHHVIDTCRKYHVEPLVTLYHYDLPESIYEAGGWENRNIVEQFVEYARICFEEYGQKVNYWVTINEPNYETLCCYGFGNYPPNVKDLGRRWRAMHHMLLASARADGALEIFCQWFQKKPLSNRAALRDIIFPDPVYCDRLLSLEDKLDSHLAHATVFTATGFDDAANVLPLSSLSCPACQALPRIGLHIHIYNGALAQEFSRYLQQFPVPFDVFVTHVKDADRCHLQTLFNQDVLPLANAVTIVQTPNRGRDVAPWLSGVGQELQRYDLCCHVHAKESVYAAPGFGTAWRTYLLDNLLQPAAVWATLAAFASDQHLGCVFPAFYKFLKEGMTHAGTPPYSTSTEYSMILDLMSRMGLPGEYARSEQFFSGGTMFWYRPQALQPLLECGLRFEDFPEEPIGVGGTLAHALERVPPLVCTRRGYRVRSLTCFPSTHYLPERFQD